MDEDDIFGNSDTGENFDDWDVTETDNNNGSWDSWGSNDTTVPQRDDTQQFIQQDDTQQFIQPDPVDNFQQPDEFDNPVQEDSFAPRVGHKTAALIIAGGCIVVALVLYFVSNIHITPNDNNQQYQEQIAQEENNMQQNEHPQQEQQQGQEQDIPLDSSGKAVLVEIPNGTGMNYNKEVFEGNGTITSKQRYVLGNQIIYCLNISIALAETSREISHYCNYDTYDSVNEGDMVSLSYQVVNDSYISVNSISR